MGWTPTGIIFVTVIMKRAFTLWFLASGVPSLSHFLKFDRSRSDLLLFQENPFAYSTDSLDLMVVEGKETEGDLSTLS